MSRHKYPIKDFTKGVVLKADLLGSSAIMRTMGFNIGTKAGTLQTNGGWEDWDTPKDFEEINGLYRWYDEDGGATLFVFGNDTVQYGVKRYDIESKTITNIFGDTDFDRQAPIMWINCDSVLVVLPDGKHDSPYSLRLLNSNAARITSGKLGLVRPTDLFTVTAINDVNNPNMIAGGKTYKWALSYSYGTKSEPLKYGESTLSDPVTLSLPTSAGSYSATVANFTGISGLITTINIYRTLGDGITFYKVGKITDIGVVFWYDTLKDSAVDLSQTAPIYTGLPGVIRCGRWYNSRLYYFGNDGVFRWTAAGLPDIHPGSFFLVVSNKGFKGTWVGVIRDNIYVGKEDGIYLIWGDSPNYRYKKISDVQCFSRASMVEMSDGIYFLGKEAYEYTKVYKFDGYNTIPISDAITPIFSNLTKDAHKRAFAIRKGKEYWLALPILDLRYAFWPTAQNNIVLVYNTETGGWFPTYGQCAAFTLFNGDQDNFELYMCESNPFSSASKGTFFKFVPMLSITNSTTYVSGVISYSKSAVGAKIFTIGNLPGVDGEGKLVKITIENLKVRVRGFLGSNPTVLIYIDSDTLDQAISSTISAEVSDEMSEVITVGNTAPIYDTGKWGSAIPLDTLSEERVFNFKDTILRNGYAFNFRFAFANSKFLSIEGAELSYELTYKE